MARPPTPGFSPLLQEALLAILCFDDSPGGARAVAGLVSANLYDLYYREIAAEAEAYLDRYKKPPAGATLDLVDTLGARQPDRAEQYNRIYKSLLTAKEGVAQQRDFYIAQARLFARAQRVRAAMPRLLQLTSKHTEQAANELDGLIADLAKPQQDLADHGTLMNDPAQALRFLDKREGRYLRWGIPELDRHDLGPVMGGLEMFIGAANRGKSAACVHLGRVNHLMGRRVLHVTAEMSEAMVAQRYCQSFYSVTKREVKGLTSLRFENDDLGRTVAWQPQKMGRRPHLGQPDIREWLTDRMEGFRRRAALRIKQFPTGQLSVRGLNAYLDALEGQGFKPELLIVDYPDLMKLDHKNRRESLGGLYVDLRGIAVERDLAVFAPTQSNKIGLKARTASLEHAAEDFSKAATADTVITYNQTDAEYELGLARLFVAKARDDVKHFTVHISQCYAAGQFCLHSARMLDSQYWPLLKRGDEEPSDEEAEAEESTKPRPRREGTTRS